MNCLLDSNIVSLAMSGDATVAHELRRLAPGSAAISAVTYAEVHYGLQRMAAAPMSLHRRQTMTDKENLFERLIEHVDVLAWDRQAAAAYSLERVACERDGETLSMQDLMILAHACSTHRVLVTRDSALRRRAHKGPHRAEIISW